MWIKITIVVLFIGLLLSLSSGLVYLMKDIGVPESKRTLYALGARITIATLLLGFIGFHIYSGNLQNTAPWDKTRPAANSSTTNN